MSIPSYLMPIIGGIIGLVLDYLAFRASRRDDKELGVPLGSWKWEVALMRIVAGAAVGMGFTVPGVEA